MEVIQVMSYSQQVKQLREEGYTIVRQAISPEHVLRYKNLIIDYFKDGQNLCHHTTSSTPQTIKSDAINDPHFKELVEVYGNEKMLSILKEVSQDKLMWVHHSDIHMNYADAKGYHSDNQLRHIAGGNYSGNFLHQEYRVYRIATYFQDHYDNDGGFYVMPGSHLNSSLNEERYLKTKAGDAIIFDCTLQHKGGTYKDDRFAFFTALGLDNQYSELHAKGVLHRYAKQNRSPYVLQDYVKQKMEQLNIKC